MPHSLMKNHPAEDDIRNALLALADKLGDYEQTTHGYIGGEYIESVAQALVEAYRDPRAYTISELSQCIRGFFKTE